MLNSKRLLYKRRLLAGGGGYTKYIRYIRYPTGYSLFSPLSSPADLNIYVYIDIYIDIYACVSVRISRRNSSNGRPPDNQPGQGR